MARRFSMDSLPKAISEALAQRLIDSGFGRYEEHAAWLAEQGYEISKSALHRYAQAHRSLILQRPTELEAGQVADLRIRCLEVALKLDGSTDILMLTKNAQDLLSWVLRR